jgi:O-antigen ligase
VLLTASRTSLFAVIPAVVYIAWPKRLDAGRIVASVLLLIVSIIVLQAVLPASVIERLSSVTTSISNADIGGRVNLWIETVGVFTQHPLFGSGSASLPTLIGALSHETYLSVLAETGLVGFILFGIVLIFVFLETMRLPKGYIGLWFSSFCIWLIGVLSLSFEFRKITWLLFSFMVIQGYSLRNQWQSDKERQQISESEEKDSSGNRIIPIDLQNFSGDQRSSL